MPALNKIVDIILCVYTSNNDMQVYFLAERECMLRINGIYLGLVDLFERSVELNPEDGIVCELIPLDGFLPLSFRLDETFLLQPPPQVRLYYAQNAVAVFCMDFLRADPSMKVIWQQRFGDTLLTLAVQGKVQLYLQNSASHLLDLPQSFADCSAKEYRDCFLLSAQTGFALVSGEGELLLMSEGVVLSSDTTIKAEVPFRDCLGHTAVCEWDREKLIGCSVRTAREVTEATIALALFESVLIGADVSPYLCEELREKADDLREFLGEFVSVVLTNEQTTVGLVYPRKERIFDVRYYTVSVTDMKIDNISPLE